MSGHSPSNENATGPSEDPEHHEMGLKTASPSSTRLAMGQDEPEYGHHLESKQSEDLEDSDLTATAENLALYLSSLQTEENSDQLSDNQEISQTINSTGSPPDNDENAELQYDDIAQMLEAAAAAAVEESRSHSESQTQDTKMSESNSINDETELQHHNDFHETEMRIVDHEGEMNETNDADLENIQESLNELVRLHGLESHLQYDEDVPHDVEQKEDSLSQTVTNSNQSSEGSSEDISNILLSALELALQGDQADDAEAEVNSAISEHSDNVDAVSEDDGNQSHSSDAEDAGFDLELLHELLMSAEHVKGKEEVVDNKAKGPSGHPNNERHVNESGESGQDNHEEILAQLSSLLHPDDIEDISVMADASNVAMDKQAAASSDDKEQEDHVDRLLHAEDEDEDRQNEDNDEEDDDEDEGPGQIDFSLVVSAIQSALEEAAGESRDTEEENHDYAEEQRSAFSKVEIQDALKSLTDSDGSILLDLSSKNLGQLSLPHAQSQEETDTLETLNEEDAEETLRSTANLVEVLLQSGLLNAESLRDGTLSKSQSKAIQRNLPAAVAARGKNNKTQKSVASQYNSTMSIAETLAYTRSHMNQRPSEAKIDPMVTRRELNRAALLKARQIGQSRGGNAPTYYVSPSSSQTQQTPEKELSYMLYTPTSTSTSKSAEATSSHRGQFRLPPSSEEASTGRRTQLPSTTRKKPNRTRFYYYTPPTSSFTSGQSTQDKSGPSFVPNAPSRPLADSTGALSAETNDVSMEDAPEDGDNNLLVALLLAKRAFGSPEDEDNDSPSEPIAIEKNHSEIVDAETMKAIQAALEAVGTSLAGEENKDKSSAAAVSKSSLPPLPLPTYPQYTTSRTSSPTPSDGTAQTSRGSFSTMSSPMRRPRRKLNGSGVMTTDDRERVRHENRERKKRWRGQNMDRNRDNDLRGRVTRKANQIYGAANTPQKMKWIEGEFQNRRMKRMERGVGFDSFSFSSFSGNKASNPVQSVMPEGSQQRFGSTEVEDSETRSASLEEDSSFQNNIPGNIWPRNSDGKNRRSPQPSSRQISGATSRPKPLSSGGTNPSFFASRGAKAPTALPMGGIVTSFKVKTNRNTLPKSKSHLFSPARNPVENSSTQNSSLSMDISDTLKRKRTVSGNIPTTHSTLSSQTMYSAGLIPPHLIPADVSPVPLPKPLPFNEPIAKRPAFRSGILVKTGEVNSSGTEPSTPSSISSTVAAISERLQEHSKSTTPAPPDNVLSDKSASPTPGTPQTSASPRPTASSRVPASSDDKRVRAMGFPPILTGLTLRR